MLLGKLLETSILLALGAEGTTVVKNVFTLAVTVGCIALCLKGCELMKGPTDGDFVSGLVVIGIAGGIFYAVSYIFFSPPKS